MKKDENKSFFYFLTFMFLALLLFASTGVYDNVMTGAAVSTGSLFDSVDFLSESVRGIMKLFFEGIFEPVFGYALDTEQTAQVVLRVMIFLFLLFIISPIFAKNDNFKKYSWILGGIISLVSAIFFPIPETFVRCDVSPLEIALLSAETELIFKTFRAVFGPIPEIEITISKNFNSSSLRKPYRSRTSSLTTR